MKIETETIQKDTGKKKWLEKSEEYQLTMRQL